MATWGASFGEGLWSALDREAQDFQRRRKARKEQERQKRLAEEEQERQKRLAEEERLRQEELANQRALNLFQMQNQDATPAYVGLGSGAGVQGIPDSMSYALNQAGIQNMTVGDHINALEAVKNKQAADALAKKEQQVKEDRDFEIYKRAQIIKANEEQEALKPYLEQKAKEAEEREVKKYNAQLELIQSQINQHNSQADENRARASYYKNGGGRGSSSKQQEELDPEEQAFLAKREELKNKLNNLNSRIGRSKEASGVFEKGGSFDEADAAIKKSVDYVREYEKIQAEYDNNEAAYSKWKTNKAAGKKTPSVNGNLRNGYIGIQNILASSGNSLKDAVNKDKRIKDYLKAEEEKKRLEEHKAKLKEAEKLARKNKQEAALMQEAQKMRQDKIDQSLKKPVPSSWDFPLLRNIYQALATSDGHLSKKELKELEKKKKQIIS